MNIAKGVGVDTGVTVGAEVIMVGVVDVEVPLTVVALVGANRAVSAIGVADANEIVTVALRVR